MNRLRRNEADNRRVKGVIAPIPFAKSLFGALKFGLFLAPLLAIASASTRPLPGEFRLTHDWVTSHFGNGKSALNTQPPFSFKIGGREWSDSRFKWVTKSAIHRLDTRRIERTNIYSEASTALQVKCTSIEWTDYPVVEWSFRILNVGNRASDAISDIRAMDVTVVRSEQGEFQLHSNTGDNNSLDSYAPHIDVLAPNSSKHFASAGGRPTTGDYPYWNIQLPEGGVIAVLSWGGQWASDFRRDGEKSLRLTAGQELTNFKLKPGEEVSSPLSILQFYQGDWIRSQNIWRRWMLADNSPRIKGKLPLPLFESNSNGYFAGLRDSYADEAMFVDKFAKEKIGVGFWDLDAGWYPCDQTKEWWEVGTWEPDKTRFPNGIKALSDHMHENGIKLILWSEPERVYKGTWLAQNHPEWIHGGAGGGLTKLDNPDCLRWITDHFDKLITDQGVDVYRQDFNIDPLPYWRASDTADRQGITELRHVENYIAYWDELLRRHPKLIIDSCASGGRRNTVQTLRRSVPILRSDDQMQPIDEQCHTYGISSWIPINGTGVTMNNDYVVRSCMTPIFGIGADVRGKVDWEAMRRDVRQWRELSQCMLGDYYPLTPYTQSKSDWIAWQWDVPESNTGMIQAFRRDDAKSDSLVVKLTGLSPNANYSVFNFDTEKTETFKGAELMNGFKVSLPAKPTAALLRYQKVR